MALKLLKNSLVALGSLLLVSFAIVKTNQEPWTAPEEYQKMKNPYAKTVDDDQIGKIIYAKQCKFCHGAKGKGDGNQANLLKTKVADFTAQNFKDQPDGSVFYKLKTGRNEMPSFDRIITDEEDLWLLVNYIKGL